MTMDHMELIDYIINIEANLKKEQLKEITDINDSLKLLKRTYLEFRKDNPKYESVYVYETARYPPNEKPHDTLN